MTRRSWAPARGSNELAPRVRDDVTRRAVQLLARRFRPTLEEEERARVHGFNYAIDVFPEWRGASFYLCVKYRTATGKPGDDFVVRTTRLRHIGRGRFELAYFRHTGRWQPVYVGLTVNECFDSIEAEEVFWPLT